MSGPTVRPKPEGVRSLDIILSCVAVFALSVAQPLLDLLGRNAEFFLARGSPPIDIVLIGVALTIVFPLAIGGLVAGVARISEPAGRVVHMVVLTVLAMPLAVVALKRTPLGKLPGAIELALALAAGAALAFAFWRYVAMRSVMRVAALASLVVLAFFLFTSSVSQLVFASEIGAPARVAVGSPAPVVMVIFDEFPVASLMDGEGELQQDLYPNFARLAEDGTWFRNATTVQQQTENSLPAMLTGNDPVGDRLPTASEYPANLFTLLADNYDVHAQEPVTKLCPEYACTNSTRPSLPIGDRWSLLADDLRIVAGHLFLPDDLAERLPAIDQSWTNFGDDGLAEATDLDMIELFMEEVDADRRLPIARFLDEIETPGTEPPFHFIHALLPHIPWMYLPSGQTYPTLTPLPGSVPRGWTDDEWLVDQAYQQHLLQVQYTDTIIGDVIDRLEAAGIYDDALIVVTADHGVTVRPGIPHRRKATPETVGDIAAIPLFIKRPNDEGSAPDDYRAETIDVLPTIADVLGIEIPWSTEGIPLFSTDRPIRTESTITGDDGAIVFGVDGAEARALAARKIEHFGTDGPLGLTPPGQADLLGTDIDEMEVEPFAGVLATIRDRTAFESVDLDGPFLPAQVIGTLRSTEAIDDDLLVAIGVNGVIAAVTRSFTDDALVRFTAVIPPSSLVEGANRLDVLLIEGSGDDRVLRRTTLDT